MWYFEFEKLGYSCYFYVIFHIFMGDISKCRDEVIFCRRRTNIIWMAIVCTVVTCVHLIIYYNNRVYISTLICFSFTSNSLFLYVHCVSYWLIHLEKILVILDNLGGCCGISNIFIGQRQIQIVTWNNCNWNRGIVKFCRKI